MSFLDNIEKEIGVVETTMASVWSKIIAGVHLAEEELTAFETWLAKEAPAVSGGLAELSQLAELAAPLTPTAPGVAAAVAAALEVASQATTVIGNVAANQSANAAQGLTNTPTSIISIYTNLKGAAASIATAASNLATAIHTAPAAPVAAAGGKAS
jgi:hypothetical protein